MVRPYKEEVVADVRPTLLLVMGSGAFLLLVTCANVANLLLLRTHGRRLGLGVARALGASEWNVARQLLIESLLLTVSGSLLGLGLADLATATRFGFEPHQLPRLGEVGVGAPVVALVAALALLSAVFMAAVCFFSTRRQVAGPALSSMRSRSATDGHEGQTGRRLLVAAQMAMALTLLVGSGLMARTYWHLQRADLGFESRDRLSFRLSTGYLGLDAGYGDMADLHDRVLQRLRAVPGVEAVEAGSIAVFPLVLPEAIDFQPIVPAEGFERIGTPEPQALVGYATSGYFDAMGIPLLSGRRFETRDASLDAPGVIVSRSLADALFGDTEPLGRSLRFADFPRWSSLTVVGIVGDVPGRTVREGASRAIYFPLVHPAAADVVAAGVYRYRPDDERYVIRTARDVASIVPELRSAAQEVDPRLPLLDLTPVDEIVGEAAARERVVMRVLMVSGAAALFLGVVGVYGVLGYAVRRRTAELGIRLALGASPKEVIRQIVTQGAALSTAGIVAGIAAALLLTRFMGALLYRTSPTDPLTFTATALLLMAVSLAASYLPARRASRIDPAQALRGE
jgi:predicted permease